MKNLDENIIEKKRFRLTPAVYLILEKDNKVLLLKRANTGFQDGKYGLVSGHMDGKETIAQAMIREAREEAGIEIASEDLEFVHVMHRFNDELGYFDQGEKHVERLDFFLRAKNWTGEIKNMEPHKCDDLSWFDVNSLPANTIDYILDAIKFANDKKYYSEFGWNN